MGWVSMHATHANPHGSTAEQARCCVFANTLHRVGLAHRQVAKVAFLG